VDVTIRGQFTHGVVGLAKYSWQGHRFLSEARSISSCPAIVVRARNTSGAIPV